MNEANLTRFGPEVYARVADEDKTYTAGFKAISGPARIRIQRDNCEAARITINGAEVDTNGDGEFPLTLEQDNTIEVTLAGGSPGSMSLRVTQVTQADLGVVCQGYFGLNTSDMEKQRALYQTMGFIGEIYPAGPETSTSFARSLGFEDDYLIYVSLHSLENPPTMPFVDTVQFRGDSFRAEPPYANLNHLGMSYATYSTTNLEGDYSYLKSKGVKFLSPPTAAPNGEQFTFMQDQDGAYIKLIAVDGEANSSGANFQRLVNTNMNVSDMERSREFYRLVGFSESVSASQAGDGDFANAHGFDGAIEFIGEDISLGEGTDGATLQLRQWRQPYDDSPTYPPPVNHLGIDRINFYVQDLKHVIKTMNDLGFEQLGPIGGPIEGGPDVGIVFFFDPDGIKVQFAGPLNV